ncbi:hypothetical protein EDD16DRAFT_1573531 [Pisolithus croceorrhizus]|nr:hypothetical protein EDD16DRAFT_1573531 [Pisolithus croceorrhizus]
MDTLVAELGLLPIKEIQRHLIGIMSISKEEIANGTTELIDTLRAAAQGYQAQKVAARQQRRAEKHRIEEDPDAGTSNKIRRTDDKDKSTSFLELPSAEELNACYRAFHAATDNQALLSAPCGVCARECNVRQRGLRRMKLLDIPHQE